MPLARGNVEMEPAQPAHEEVRLHGVRDAAPAPIDREVLRGWLGNDEAAIRALLVEFLGNARQMVSEIDAIYFMVSSVFGFSMSKSSP